MRITTTLMTATILSSLAVAASADADISYTSTVGGNAGDVLPTTNFTSGAPAGWSIAYNGDGGIRQGSTEEWAAPYLSHQQGSFFGLTPVNGPDNDPYLSSGLGTANVRGFGDAIALKMLWGSVDSYNTLNLIANGQIVGSLVGADISPNPNGDRGENNTFFVNLTSAEPFDEVELISAGAHAFETTAWYVTNVSVPEPAALALFGVGLLGLGFIMHRKANFGGSGQPFDSIRYGGRR